MSYTLNQAAKATGKSKSTISVAIKNGRITAIKGDDGSWLIDPAELHRIYPPLSETPNRRTHRDELSSAEHLMRIRELETRLDASMQLCRVLENQIDDIKEDRNRWRQQATALLEAPRQSATSVFARGWQWLFGKERTA